jgi:hypothetical protein
LVRTQRSRADTCDQLASREHVSTPALCSAG